MKLVVIEGVGKKDTVKKYLGNDFEVMATKGHVRDLPEKSLAVDVNNNFEPQYVIMPDKQSIVNELQNKCKKAERVYLATDPDREGEAISWHLCYILGLNVNDPVRIEFNEISKNAVQNALLHPRGIDLNLVNAQQARRVLDRLVGYKLSPIICRKVQSNLSAGRVQSATLKLVVDRERSIRNFVKEEYWSVVVDLFKDIADNSFKATLAKYKNKKYVPRSKEEVDKLLKYLSEHTYNVTNVKKSISKTHPSAPFTTSTMQQDALNKLGMNLKKVTSCAQQLYEGVQIADEGKVALITYIRTDSVRVSPEATKMAKEYILEHFGESYYPKTPNVYKVKKSAQDAHEAIRPINLKRTPESVKNYLSPDNYKLYKLVYDKFLASQMAEATFDALNVEIDNGGFLFKASGKTPIFDGFMRIYNASKKKKVEKEDNAEDSDESENAKMPALVEGDVLSMCGITPTQKFTKPLPRYTEATLVKEMEDKGIGRPATYTPTITLLSSRKYIEHEGKFLYPTELGFKVDELLEKYFGDIINVKFTAEMEDKLDEVAKNGIEWQSFVGEFYKHFEESLKKADKDYSKFKIEPKETDIVCEKCGNKMLLRTSKYGEFLACSNYPRCKNIQPVKKMVGKCPLCGSDVLEMKSKKGKIFYGCDKYPECKFSSWEIPIEEKCPKCGKYMTQKTLYGNIRIKCSSCDYTRTEKKQKQSENVNSEN